MTEMELPVPASVMSERTVLGAILLDSGCIGVTESLSTEHFTLDSHRKIYRALMELWDEGIGADVSLLVNHLHSRQMLQSVGGVGYVSNLTDGVTAKNTEFHVRILHEKKQLRDIISNAQKAVARAYSQHEKPTDIMADWDRVSAVIGADTHVKDQDIFLDAEKFCKQYHAKVEWRVDQVIEIGTNGLMLGLPKEGKSPAARSLAVSLAAGIPWLDFHCKRTRTALVSREDYPGTTSRFIDNYRKAYGLEWDQLRPWLYINSRAQTPTLYLDKPSDLRLLINNLKSRQIEFCILDVLKVMHNQDENDSTDMDRVMASINHIRDEVGCQLMVLHHTTKAESQTLASSARGAGAIGGFAEFIIGIKSEDQEIGMRKMTFNLKACEPHPSLYWKIADQPNGGVTLERDDTWKPKTEAKKRPLMSV